MNPSDAPSALNQEQARLRREEAAKRQQLQLRAQAIKIVQERELGARKKEAATSATKAQPKPLSSRSVYTPPPPKKTTVKTAAPKVAVSPAAAPPATPTGVHAVVASSRKVPLASPPKLDPEEMRAEMRDFTGENDPPAPPADTPAPAPAKVEVPVKAKKSVRLKAEEPPPLPALEEIEIETVPAEPEIPQLRLSIRSPGDSDGPMMLDIPDEPQAPALNVLTRAHTLKLKMEKSGELSCPKCGWLILAAQRGANYTECRRCGEIIKSDAE